MKITKKELQCLIKESIFDSMRRGIAGTFGIESMKDAPREPLNPVSNTALCMTGNKRSGHIILYTKSLPDGEVTYQNFKNFQNVIGFVKFNTTAKPCIPETIEVKFTAVDRPYQGKGYSALLKGILFQYAKDNNLGVTSDHTQSTSPSAARFWKKLPYTSGYVKRETPAGNNEFDYTGSTPDIYDDCSSGLYGPKGMATHNSWEVNHDSFKNHMNELLVAHEAHIDFLSSLANSKVMKIKMKRFVEKDLKEKSVEVFGKNLR